LGTCFFHKFFQPLFGQMIVQGTVFLLFEEDDILNAEHSKTPFESVVQFEAILWPDIALN